MQKCTRCGDVIGAAGAYSVGMNNTVWCTVECFTGKPKRVAEVVIVAVPMSPPPQPTPVVEAVPPPVTILVKAPEVAVEPPKPLEKALDVKKDVKAKKVVVKKEPAPKKGAATKKGKK